MVAGPAMYLATVPATKVHGTSQHPAHTQDHQVLDVQKNLGSLRLIYGFQRLLADELLTKLVNELKQHPRCS